MTGQRSDGWWQASDGRWYPPDARGGSTPPPPGTPAGAAPAAGGGRTALWIALAAVVALAVGIAGAIVIAGGDDDTATGSSDDDTEAVEVLLEPTASTGPDPFSTATTVVDLGEDVTRTLVSVPTGDPSSSGGVELVGTEPGLYGGSRDTQVCDVAALSAFLTDPANGAIAAAWAEVEGVGTDEIDATLSQWTPLLLRSDTVVTNHGYDAAAGTATPRQSVLQAGTAVLVDATGLPRVRCACGNPLAAPTVGSGFRAAGDQWAGFSAGETATIRPGTAVEALTVLDPATGETFEQPVGEPPSAELVLMTDNLDGYPDDIGVGVLDEDGEITARVSLFTSPEDALAVLTPVLGAPPFDQSEVDRCSWAPECEFRRMAWPGLYLIFVDGGLEGAWIYDADGAPTFDTQGLPAPSTDPGWATDLGGTLGATEGELQRIHAYQLDPYSRIMNVTYGPDGGAVAIGVDAGGG